MVQNEYSEVSLSFNSFPAEQCRALHFLPYVHQQLNLFWVYILILFYLLLFLLLLQLKNKICLHCGLVLVINAG